LKMALSAGDTNALRKLANAEADEQDVSALTAPPVEEESSSDEPCGAPSLDYGAAVAAYHAKKKSKKKKAPEKGSLRRPRRKPLPKKQPEQKEEKTEDGAAGGHLMDAAKKGMRYNKATKTWVPITITQGRKEDVWKGTIEKVFKSGYYRIPIFQRRYAWGPEQWNLLLADTLTSLKTGKEHSLRRVNVLQLDRSQAVPKTLVIDGQQRLTTCTLLLAAIRDYAVQSGAKGAEALATRINSVLFPNAAGLKTWAETNKGEPIEEGCDLACCVLSPTFFDRQAYVAAVLPHTHLPAKTKITGPDQTLVAKRHFQAKLAHRNTMWALRFCTAPSRPAPPIGQPDVERLVKGLAKLTECLLAKITVLYFGIDLSEGRPSERLQIVFERLAEHCNTFERATRSGEGIAMSGVAFIRNLVLSCFPLEEDAVKVYKEKWLPLERAAGVTEADVEAFFNAFLDSKRCATAQQGLIGGGLYPRFRRWFNRQVGKDQAQAKKDAVAAVDEMTWYATRWSRARRAVDAAREKEDEAKEDDLGV